MIKRLIFDVDGTLIREEKEIKAEQDIIRANIEKRKNNLELL